MKKMETKYSERAYKLAIDHTKYNSDGKAVIPCNDEWRAEKEWDVMFEQIQMEQVIFSELL